MIAWGRKEDIQGVVANVPDNWLIRFAANRPNDTRKFGDSRNATLLFRSAGVLEAVEAGEMFLTVTERRQK